MAKQSKERKSGVFALEFVGSLFYLAVVFTGMATSYMNPVWNAAATLWLPLLYGAAVISAIALFFVSFANLSAPNWKTSKCALCASVIGGFSLVALTAGNATFFLASIIGFVLAFVGSGMANME